MTSVLGKRKTRHTEEKAESPENLEDARTILQRHFEARFKPLKVASLKPSRLDSDEEDEDDSTISDESESEWDGISESGGDGKPDALTSPGNCC